MTNTGLLFVLLSVLFVSHDAVGQKVTAFVGDESVHLPFNTNPIALSKNPVAEWKRSDTEEVVHYKVSTGSAEVDDLRRQSALFKDRTQMKSDALGTGDLTLVLKDPNLTDTGTYTCVFSQVTAEGPTELGRTVVELTVREPVPVPPVPGWGIALLVISGLGVLFGAVSSALAINRQKETKESFREAYVGLVTHKPPQSTGGRSTAGKEDTY